MGVRKQFGYKRIMIIIIGVIAGGVSGFLYWKYVGCVSGNCAITSVWYRSTMYGMLMGGLLTDTFRDFIK
jgi:hypothetical protein